MLFFLMCFDNSHADFHYVNKKHDKYNLDKKFEVILSCSEKLNQNTSKGLVVYDFYEKIYKIFSYYGNNFSKSDEFYLDGADSDFFFLRKHT